MAGNKSKPIGKKISSSAATTRSKELCFNIEREFEVVRVVSEKTCKSQVYYEIEWKGYDTTTWEPRINLTGCDKILREWRTHSKNPQERILSGKKNLKRSLSIPGVQKALKKIKAELDDGRGSIESLTEGAITKGDRVEIIQNRTPARRNSIQLSTPDHPDTVKFQEKLDQLPGPRVTLVNTTGDGEHSPPLDFELIRELRLSEDVPVKDSDFLFGCSCPASGCTDPTVCDCVKDLIPQQFAYKNGVIRTGFDNQNVVYECNPKCSCTIECGNRVVERGRQVELQIFRTQNKGWGLRCPVALPRGTFIDLYLGEVIGDEEAIRRAELADTKGVSYLFDLDKFAEMPEYHHQLQAEGKFTIDGEACGSIARFINHSCDPNLQTYAVLNDPSERRVYNLGLFTGRKVSAYEELTFSYADADKPSTTDKEDADPSRWTCKCGAKNCRGYIWH
ncbi:SET domain-containing protein [Morchella conica CCBAS932]|uniref:Histone-lysine N-methyltransferase n=2 Tax=Morchella sect. Distantes TaxID=1051054 RepID=A0A3N4L2U4_9PEZI|nr:SET domain-containing protein [Morchella conica CCBAS932]